MYGLGCVDYYLFTETITEVLNPLTNECSLDLRTSLPNLVARVVGKER